MKKFILLGLGLLPIAAVACEKEGPAEKLGEKIDKKVEDIKETGKEMKEDIKSTGQEVKEDVQELGN